MKCYICNKNFNIKRNLKDLFSTKEFYICDECYKKYKINISYDVLPLENHKLYIYSLFEEEYIFKSDPFIAEFSKLFEYVLSQTSDENILVYKNINLTKYKLEMLNNLSNLLENDIYLVCNSHKM